MSDKDEIHKALAKMEAEAAKIEGVKNRERQRTKRQTAEVVEKDRVKEIEEQNKEHHQEAVSKVKWGTIFILISCLMSFMYMRSLNPHQRSELVQDVVIYSLGVGLVIVAMLKR